MSEETRMTEIRLHGRGGQGGVSCAKILAAAYARLGKSVQAFGDYAGERSGAPVRAYLRVSDDPIGNRNKVYRPDHLLVLDPTLLGPDVVAGLAAGGTMLVNSPDPPEAFSDRFGAFRLAVVDATAIARRRRIGSRSLVIVNTTIAGAFARAFGLPLGLLEEVYREMGFSSNLEAAKEADGAVRILDPSEKGRGKAAPASGRAVPAGRQEVPALPLHVESAPTNLRTGTWRTQTPCYVRREAPCSAACPAGNDVVGFVQALAASGTDAAAEILARTTPLAAVCGRVCPAPCMTGCNRRAYDGAVDVRGLERWIADRTTASPRDRAAPLQGSPVAVVGGGPAGLSAAYALAQRKRAVVLFDNQRELGGVLRNGIPSYRLPRQVLDREVAAILRLGVEARCGERVDTGRLVELARTFEAVILATGLQGEAALDLPGASLAGVEQGIRFLARVNAGAPPGISGHVVVAGGGNTAIDCARTALRSGAQRVTVAYRRGRAEMPAIPEEVDEALEEGVEFLFQRQPVAFSGEARVGAVVLAEVDLGPPDQTGRRRPVTSERTQSLACDTVLLALGQRPDLALLPRGWEIRQERVWRDGSPLSVFAAGDLGTQAGTVAHAIGSGRRAALLALGDDLREDAGDGGPGPVPPERIRTWHFDRIDPARRRLASPVERRDGFAEVDAGLADAAEARRCFSCGVCTHCDRCLVYCPEGIIRRSGGAYAVDADYCKGCGVCAVECPRGALEMDVP